ncbi:MAG: efflux RND transporter permease subunit [Flavobacteriaceae bacterium]|nr:efflux RND transporter permease subunit [Flavobacteriaceae bacterium]
MGFWNRIARFILTSRYLILAVIFIITVFLASQMQYMKFTHTEANLLPEDHEVNITYNKFLEVFGEEGNIVILAVQDPQLFTPEKFNHWSKLSDKLKTFDEVELTVALSDIKKLVKDETQEKFVPQSLAEGEIHSIEEIQKLKNEVFNNLPFYDNFIYNKETGSIRTMMYLKKDIINTKIRERFIMDKFIPLIENFEKESGLKVHVSGMPYIRTLNSQNIIDEMGMFVGLALLITTLIFFFFFRSYRATLITFLVVSIGVIWAFGFIGLLRYEITVLTALIPPLIIVIGVPNAIFLINKYQQEIKIHGNQAKSLIRVISKIGNASFLTNITTASGFATFMFTNSQLLREFGIIASINIMAIFLLSILLIPIIYSFMRIPKRKHLKHLERKWIDGIVSWMEKMVKNHRFAIYATTTTLIIISMIGIYMIRISGSIIEDMPKGKPFFKDILFFEKEFGGIMPLEILIDTKEKNGVMKLSTLKKIERLQDEIDEIPELSKPISIVNAVKYSKQAYYNGNPKYYQLPTSIEKNFILSYIKNSSNDMNGLNNFVDSTGRYVRVTSFMKDIGTDKMDKIEERLWGIINKEFPQERYSVIMTGKALVFLKGTNYLVQNLAVSLLLAIILIGLFMAFMFRSFRMIIISIIPNIIPLLITAGLMGYFGIPIKPSTILVFSIAFGISVDDTIHFLAKYRQELIVNNWEINKSVFASLRGAGISMFYTSIVLFFGFLVFTVSSFGGTIALGGLVSVTLLVAMLSNLLLLPSLLLSLESFIANKQTLKEPIIEIDLIEMEDEEVDKK